MDEYKHTILEPVSEIPETDELPEGMISVELTDKEPYNIRYFHMVPYPAADGSILHINIYVPETRKNRNPEETFPLIAYVQGSGFGKQDLSVEMFAHTWMCQKGYVVASIEYRPASVSPFPAQTMDIKNGIRFLKKNAAKYSIDPSKCAVWGGSSGGHTSLCVGITGDSALIAPFGDDDSVSAEVQAIVDWYGPTDFEAMSYYPSKMEHITPTCPEGMEIGKLNVMENKDKAAAANPINYLSADRPTAPMLIMHGGKDALVPFNQSVRLYRRMKELGKEVEFYRLIGADHGFNGFLCTESYQIVESFFRKHLCS